MSLSARVTLFAFAVAATLGSGVSTAADYFGPTMNRAGYYGASSRSYWNNDYRLRPACAKCESTGVCNCGPNCNCDNGCCDSTNSIYGLGWKSGYLSDSSWKYGNSLNSGWKGQGCNGNCSGGSCSPSFDDTFGSRYRTMPSWSRYDGRYNNVPRLGSSLPPFYRNGNHPLFD